MPMVVSNHQRIFFRFEGERGAFLMLHHGLFGSHDDWYRAGYVEELSKEFRLVIPDARGHGRSDHPSDVADYQPERFAEDLIEIINGLGIRNLHFLGYGMGALIGLEMLRRFPERVRIAVLGGEAPLMLPPVQTYWRGLVERLERGTLAELVGDFRAHQQWLQGEAAGPPEEERPSALAILQALSNWEVHGEDRISVTSPVTLFAGSDDPAAERVERARAYINRARLVLFPGLNHAKLFGERTQITQELVRLLKSGRREDGDPQHRRHGMEAGESRGSGDAPYQRHEERRYGGRDARPPDNRDDRRIRDRRNSGRRDFQQRSGNAIDGRRPGGGMDPAAESGADSLAAADGPASADIERSASPGQGTEGATRDHRVETSDVNTPAANPSTEPQNPQASGTSPKDQKESQG